MITEKKNTETTDLLRENYLAQVDYVFIQYRQPLLTYFVKIKPMWSFYIVSCCFLLTVWENLDGVFYDF